MVTENCKKIEPVVQSYVQKQNMPLFSEHGVVHCSTDGTMLVFFVHIVPPNLLTCVDTGYVSVSMSDDTSVYCTCCRLSQ